ncbi:hypothetical protein RB195_000233 [Necator americanus]|uniref:NHL repeat protein n=1 Tax=Necator americanus TaxID=51031 RepID=A0ABR1D9G9_NECAM
MTGSESPIETTCFPPSKGGVTVMLVDAYPHLRSPVSCLFYQFVFKRYIEDDVFTDEELDCIQNEIARVVRRFDELGLDHYSFEANTLPQSSTGLDANPSVSHLYRFLFNTYSKDHSLSLEEMDVIYAGILEVVERFNEIKAYRSCQDAICSEYEKESTSSSNGNNGGSSESHMETNAKLTNIQFPAVSSDGGRDHADRRSHLDSSPQSKYSPGNVNDNTGASPTMSSAYAGESKEDSRSSKKCNVVNTEFVSKKPVLSRSTIPSPEACGSTAFPSHLDPYSEPKNSSCFDTHSHGRRLRFTEFAKPYSGIEVSVSGSLSQKFEGKGFNRPLGVTFDEESQQWIVADTMNNRIVLVPRGVIMTSSDIIAPSAVTVLRPAYSFVVLTKCEIRILHYGKLESDLVIVHSGNARGLSLTARGNIVTMEKIRGFWQVSVYEGRPKATLIWSYPYPTIRDALPSFLDLYRGVLVITDLGTQSIVKFYDDTGTDRFKHNRSITLAPDSKNGRRGTVSYISGVFIDEDFNLLIADAKGRSLQVFNNDCVYLYSVKLLGGGFPFISGIWVNRSGYIGVCARGQKDGEHPMVRMIMYMRQQRMTEGTAYDPKGKVERMGYSRNSERKVPVATPTTAEERAAKQKEIIAA